MDINLMYLTCANSERPSGYWLKDKESSERCFRSLNVEPTSDTTRDQKRSNIITLRRGIYSPHAITASLFHRRITLLKRSPLIQERLPLHMRGRQRIAHGAQTLLYGAWTPLYCRKDLLMT